jgi:hypothetical protein
VGLCVPSIPQAWGALQALNMQSGLLLAQAWAVRRRTPATGHGQARVPCRVLCAPATNGDPLRLAGIGVGVGRGPRNVSLRMGPVTGKQRARPAGAMARPWPGEHAPHALPLPQPTAPEASGP